MNELTTSHNPLLSILIWTASDDAMPVVSENVLHSRAHGSKEVTELIRASVAPNTRRAYNSDLQHFGRFGGTIPCSPEVVASYIATCAKLHRPCTIQRRVVAIGRVHRSIGADDPTKSDLVKAVIRGVRRSVGVSQKQASPLLPTQLSALEPRMTGLKGTRDRALMLLGFAGALRRSELVALNVDDLEWLDEGLVLHLRRGKTDQEGVGRKIAIPHGMRLVCPVKAAREWLVAGKVDAGPLFRRIGRSGVVGITRLTAQSVNLIIKSRITELGLKAANYSGHSLRAGLVTSAARAGVSLHKIMDQTGHRSVEMVGRYIRDTNQFEDNAAGAVL